MFIPVGVWLLIIEVGIFPHVKRGFFCDDRSIGLKFIGDTISTGVVLLSITFAFPILWICESIFFKQVSLKSSRFVGSAGNAWMWFKEYLFGMILHLFIVDASKVRKKSYLFCIDFDIYKDFWPKFMGSTWFLSPRKFSFQPIPTVPQKTFKLIFLKKKNRGKT